MGQAVHGFDIWLLLLSNGGSSMAACAALMLELQSATGGATASSFPTEDIWVDSSMEQLPIKLL
jgi:hypothetical protein